MANIRVFPRLMVLPAVLLLSANLYALSINAVKRDLSDNTATISFCGVFEIKNISVEETPFGEVASMPKELGGYANIIVTSKKLDEAVKLCHSAKCKAVKCSAYPEYKLLTARKLKSGKSVLAKVSFDEELTITFFVSKYKRGNKDIHRVNPPRDFEFTDKKYKNQVRQFLIGRTKDLL
jgi:hypothetical protein